MKEQTQQLGIRINTKLYKELQKQAQTKMTKTSELIRQYLSEKTKENQKKEV